MNIVIDTNVILSATIFLSSIPRKAVELARMHGTILISNEVFEEYQKKVRNNKFDKYTSVYNRETFLSRIAETSLTIPITQTIKICRDPKDDKFLELAVSGNADYIITGDEDLLALHPFRNISILTPKQFLEIHAAKQGTDARVS